MFSTTYPCHHCARKIISAGIKEVVFISPYLKSLAMEMFDSEITDHESESNTKVWFHSFCGIAPKLYEKAFKMRNKKYDDDGKVISWNPELIL